MNFLFERPIPEVILGVIFWGRIPPKQLTRLQSSAIILGYKGRQDQVDTPEFKQAILSPFLINLFMYQFNLKGDMGRHHLSISGAYSECGISTSTINRSAGKSFPPKVKLSEGRVGFRLYQIEEWLNGKRGGWN
ncbi:AlpA family phage regulatory protein [Prochlorococcus sp. AH-736-A13]|nr:AlpA family phage regulatory protein [Prochlorococcus sp. AH-736-A13]